MMTRDDAVAAAAHFLTGRAYPECADSVVMLPDLAEEFPYGWTVRFDFKEHIETGDPAKAPFTSVVVVPHEGEAVHFPPTALPVGDYMNRRATGGWPPKEWP
ncbi:YrhB domain-containing protein [Streptomyces sp. MS06]|uniref:YrhB domain-containing protein n=1 Tax=Streptomyces sp. MS06 TaxID=3385974 RepID=UPI0039A0B53C